MEKPELKGDILFTLPLPAEWQTEEAWNTLCRLTNDFMTFTQYTDEHEHPDGHHLVIRKFADETERQAMYDFWEAEIAESQAQLKAKEQTDDD